MNNNLGWTDHRMDALLQIFCKKNCREIIIIKSMFHSITFNWCGSCDSNICLRRVQNRPLFSLVGNGQGLVVNPNCKTNPNPNQPR